MLQGKNDLNEEIVLENLGYQVLDFTTKDGVA